MTEQQYMTTKSFTLDGESIDQLEKLAEHDDRSQSWIIRSLINKEFARVFPQPAAATAEQK